MFQNSGIPCINNKFSFTLSLENFTIISYSLNTELTYSRKIWGQDLLQAKINCISFEREKENKSLTEIYKYRALLSISSFIILLNPFQ